MKLEVCTDALEGVKMAQAGGAHRVELCAALSVGGLTPSIGLVRSCCAEADLEVHAMIRLREGDFCYKKEEIKQMRTDIGVLADAGVKGVVLGCLTTDRQLDIPALKVLLNEVRKYPLELTFHRAFDVLVQPFDALEQLIALGVDRVLTTGGAATAFEGRAQLAQYVQHAQGRIEVMAGGGILPENAQAIAQTGVDALHFTAHHQEAETTIGGMGWKSQPNPVKLEGIRSLFNR